MSRWLVAAVVVALLAAAGCGSDAGRASPGAADVRQDRSLTRTEWQLTRVVEPSRTWSPPPEVDAVLRFDGEGHFSATACNHYSGPVRIDAGRLRLGQMLGTDMGCGGPRGKVEAAFLAVMDGEVRWAVSGEELRLDKPDGPGSGRGHNGIEGLLRMVPLYVRGAGVTGVGRVLRAGRCVAGPALVHGPRPAA
jgi:heat shock protein HslJ